jgi:hypothetical protein
MEWQNEGHGGSDSIDYYFFNYLINQGEKCGDALYDAQVQSMTMRPFRLARQ